MKRNLTREECLNSKPRVFKWAYWQLVEKSPIPLRALTEPNGFPAAFQPVLHRDRWMNVNATNGLARYRLARVVNGLFGPMLVRRSKVEAALEMIPGES